MLLVRCTGGGIILLDVSLIHALEVDVCGTLGRLLGHPCILTLVARAKCSGASVVLLILLAILVVPRLRLCLVSLLRWLQKAFEHLDCPFVSCGLGGSEAACTSLS